MKAVSFVDVLLHRVERHPERHAFIMLENGEDEKSKITYRQLDRRAQAIGAAIQQVGGVGRPVILAHLPGLEYVAALFGCFYAGAVAVPVYPPRSSRHETRLKAIIADTGAELILTASSLLSSAQQSMDKEQERGKIQWLATDILSGELAEDWRCPIIDPQALALLQYTSGSTAAPKGVMVSHANLLHNQFALLAGFHQTEQSTIVNWLPPYHDMGLMGNILHPVYVGALCVTMPPLAFMQKPERWLRAISRYHATTSGGPNFAYDLCARRIGPDDLHGLDLSGWSIAFNGSERVQLETIERFIKAFAPAGFRRDAFRVCYGLAEATLIVSVRGNDATAQSKTLNDRTPTQKKNIDDQTMAAESGNAVSCGFGVVGHKIVIASPDSLTECVDGEVGEVWVSGPSIAQGYWNRPYETEQAFKAFLSDTKSGPFLRTGDLGFLSGCELFVLGRIKELVVIRGVNHYPEDIEATARACHPLLEKGRGAAFSVDLSGEERLVIVHEVKIRGLSEPEDIVGRIRQAVSKEYGLQVYAVVLVKPGGIPKTSSGKIQRRICREKFLTGNLDSWLADILTDEGIKYLDSNCDCEQILSMNAERRREALEDYLTRMIAQSAGISQARLRNLKSIHQVGIDSLKSAELVSRIEEDFDVSLPPISFLQDQSVSKLASQINGAIESRKADSRSSSSNTIPFRTSARIRPGYPLSSFQERVWQISLLTPDNPALCLHQALHFDAQPDAEALIKSVNAIVKRHETLRTKIGFEAGQPVQLIISTLTISLPIIDLRALSKDAQEVEALRISRIMAQSRFDLSQLPLLKVGLVFLGNRRSILHISLSHFIADGWSSELFIEELFIFYQAFVGGVGETPTALPLQYKDFSRRQRNWLQSEAMTLQQKYWEQQLAGIPLELKIPTDHPRSSRRSARGGRRVVNFPQELLAALQELGRREGVTLFVLLLAAFKALLYRYSGEDDITVSAPVAHRNEMEYRRLIGCFANRLLIRTRLQSHWTVRELIQSVRETTLNALANQDLPLAQIEKLIPYQCENRAANHPLSQILFQYYKVTEVWELPGLRINRLSPEIKGAPFELFILAQEMVQGLRLNCLYNSDLFEPETIEQLFDSYEAILRQFVKDTETGLGGLILQAGLEARLERFSSPEKAVIIVATFTADPLRDSLDFWARQLEFPAKVEFVQFGNVFQQLLDPNSAFTKNPNGFNVVLVRLWDWRGPSKRVPMPEDVASDIHQNIERGARDLVSALKLAVERSVSPYILGFCPPCGDSQSEALSDRWEKWVESELDGIAGLHLITTSSLLAAYPVHNPCQPYGEALGHIPYKAEFFAALGSMLARKIYALSSVPPKVIALDCDMTLWKGICGEEGPMAIELDPSSLFLQRFMKIQAEHGRLLCLCSKNNEEDVVRVFERRTDMVLQLDDLVAWRINWRAKSENLRSLADELQLGLGSFVFIDDDPMECAEVRANCPGVLTFQLPENRSSIPNFLSHIWALDRLNKTDEDKKRTVSYQQEKKRQLARSGTRNLRDFIASLNLKVDISEIISSQIPRVAQLIQRTNQFNLTCIRRSEAEIKLLWQSRKYQCLGITVEDRFGHYGLVGVIFFSFGVSSILVDTLTLSCRVLGRGVEYQVMAKLGVIADSQGLEYVEIPFNDMKSNRPIGEFLNSIGANFQHTSQSGKIFRFPSKFIERLQYLSETVEDASTNESTTPSKSLR